MKRLTAILCFLCGLLFNGQAQSLLMLAGSPPSAGEIPGVFVNASTNGNLGSDSNTGTSNSPFATAFKAESVTKNLTTPTNVYFHRSGRYEGSFRFGTNITVDAYGTATHAPYGIYGGFTNSKPILTGAIVLTNSGFALVTGKTNAWWISLVGRVPMETNTPAGLTHSNVLMCWENNVRLGGIWSTNSGYGSTNNVESGNSRFYYEPTNQMLVLSTSDGSWPTTNSRIYEASIRTLGFWGGSNVTGLNLIAEKQYGRSLPPGEGYGFGPEFCTFYFYKCTGRYNWSHSLGVANGNVTTESTFDACKVYDISCLQAGGGTSFVAYHDGPSNVTSVVFTNCLAEQPLTNRIGSTGFYTHDGGVTRVSSKFINCWSINCETGFGEGGGSVGQFTGNNTVNCTDGASLASTLAINGYTNYWTAAGAHKGLVLDSGHVYSVVNSKFIFTNTCYGINQAGTQQLYATNNVFAATGTRKGQAFSLTASASTGKLNVWTNAFRNIEIGYTDGTFTNGSGNWNTYSGLQYIGDMESGSAPSPGFWTGANLAGWITAWSPQSIDANSGTTDPSYAAGFYTVTPPDPTGGDAN